ncbi:UNVERIFIED_CONTAM: hypothetical protein Sindi_2530900 [Sesamum indicum]
MEECEAEKQQLHGIGRTVRGQRARSAVATWRMIRRSSVEIGFYTDPAFKDVLQAHSKIDLNLDPAKEQSKPTNVTTFIWKTFQCSVIENLINEDHFVSQGIILFLNSNDGNHIDVPSLNSCKGPKTKEWTLSNSPARLILLIYEYGAKLMNFVFILI